MSKKTKMETWNLANWAKIWTLKGARPFGDTQFEDYRAPASPPIPDTMLMNLSFYARSQVRPAHVAQLMDEVAG